MRLALYLPHLSRKLPTNSSNEARNTMDISYTLIVALMFITILSFGLANLLASLAEILNSKNNTKVATVHLNWIVILLIIHFNMAWHAVLIATYKSWSYDTFLFSVLGPILAFFTTRIIAPCATVDDKPATLISNYLDIRQQFFVLFAMIQAWGIGTDYLFYRGTTGSTVFNILLIFLAIVMFKTDSYQKHVYGVVVAWSLYITAIVLRSLAIIS
jgi:hypothetical protein